MSYGIFCAFVFQHCRVQLQAIVGAAGFSPTKTGCAVQYW